MKDRIERDIDELEASLIAHARKYAARLRREYKAILKQARAAHRK